MALKDTFPGKGEEYLGGESDGLVYRTVFAGSTLEASYDMILQFLREEGFGEIPLPKDAEELELFRLPTRNGQILLFEDNGYVHNPIKILFPVDRRQKRKLILEIYNSEAEDHLLRFHNRLQQRKAAVAKKEKAPRKKRKASSKSVAIQETLRPVSQDASAGKTKPPGLKTDS